eukprot:1064-Heterococcus_DN1.PRE.3
MTRLNLTTLDEMKPGAEECTIAMYGKVAHNEGVVLFEHDGTLGELSEKYKSRGVGFKLPLEQLPQSSSVIRHVRLTVVMECSRDSHGICKSEYITFTRLKEGQLVFTTRPMFYEIGFNRVCYIVVGMANKQWDVPTAQCKFEIMCQILNSTLLHRDVPGAVEFVPKIKRHT